jgi:N-acetylglucosaminyl-diphospho-decaprenol L-rhamnosyltransferase
MVARMLVLRNIGGFDERYFIYGEDLDLCLSVRKSGWTIAYIPNAVVVHWGGASERDTLPVEVWKKKFDAEFLFYEKHYSRKTIKAIRQANIIHALWRILTINLTLPLCKEKETSLKKLERYRLILTACRERNI